MEKPRGLVTKNIATEIDLKCLLKGPLQRHSVTVNGAGAETHLVKQVLEELEQLDAGDICSVCRQPELKRAPSELMLLTRRREKSTKTSRGTLTRRGYLALRTCRKKEAPPNERRCPRSARRSRSPSVGTGLYAGGVDCTRSTHACSHTWGS